MTSWTPQRRRVGLAAVGVVTLTLGCGALCMGVPCFSTGLRYGMWLDSCPSGSLRLGADLEAVGLVRGGEGTVRVRPLGRYVIGDDHHAYAGETGMYRGADVEVTLLDEHGEPVEGVEIGRFKRSRSTRHASIELPDLPDGDYTLRAAVSAPFDTIQLDLDLPLYAPAVVHVMPDRPLYRPGQPVHLRSVMLARTDMEPLEGRPGRWRVTSPDGSEMLVEKDRSGPWGISDTSFPLDHSAPHGTWRAAWESGEDRDEITFDVRPFKLPRLAAELSTERPWYSIGEPVVLEGRAQYTSGAPVADAPVEVTLARVEGRWPPPLSWEGPHTLRTDPSGRFTLELGEVPGDLVDRAVLSATARVTEAAGEVVTGSSSVVVSKDSLRVEAITELGDGLVGGYNNRAYLRVSTPDGRPLRLADLEVGNPWDPAAPVRKAQTDEDGVASLQLDPGDPVTVVVPPAPVRARPLQPPAPVMTQAKELLEGRALDLAERRAVDAMLPSVAACGDWARGDVDVSLGLGVSAGGGVTRVLASDERAVDRCVAAAARLLRFPAGSQRTLRLDWRVPDSLRPALQMDLRMAVGPESGLGSVLGDAALAARECLDRGRGVSGTEAVRGHVVVGAGRRALDVQLAPSASDTGLTRAETGCLQRAFAGLQLPEAPETDGMAAFVGTLDVPRAGATTAPQATTQTGYELSVAASVRGKPQGDGGIVLPKGSIPHLRLRAAPSLVEAGDAVEIEILRGPGFVGELPKKLAIYEGTRRLQEVEVDQEARTARFQIPDGVEGFAHVDWGGARVVVYVRPAEPLSVALSSDAEAYRPGATAKLTVRTRAGERPVAAGVGLVGVDATLGQLASLPGADAYGRVMVRAEADEPAFGAFDPRALVLGQVRGANAARAAVMRISSLPDDVAGDRRVYGDTRSAHDDLSVLTANFYRALAALRDDVRGWEAQAPEGQQMKPPRMAAMWNAVLDRFREAGEPAVDAFDRELTLQSLPDDLLAQLDPRQVVADGTRLPEDVVDWTSFARGGGR